jgi:alpha-glucoside transport system substrate-binding protein
MAAEVEHGLEAQRRQGSRPTSRRRPTAECRYRLLLCLGGVWALIAGCTDAATSQPTAISQPTATTQTAATVASRDPEDNHVRVLGLWSGPEFDSFVSVKSAWEQNTGGTVDWQGSRDLPGELDAQIERGTPPDIAILPSIGLMHELADAGQLVALPSVMDMDQLQTDYVPAWIDLGSYHGELYGIFYKVTNKATVWYNPKAFAAADYRVPSTWDEMIELADTMVADGRTPFSVVAPKVPGGGGWALTDWISQIVLNNCGPDLYDQWVAGQIPWTDACVKQSFDLFDTIVQTPGYVLGGSEGILGSSDAEGSYPMYSDPPTAYMYYLASFAQAFIASRYPQLAPGDDYDFFRFPTINPEDAGSITIGADVVVMLNDTPAARSFMTYLAGAESQQAWVELGGFTSVNRSVAADAYPEPVARAVADELASARLIRFGAGDTMPASVQQAWWKAMLDLVDDPSKLDAVLESLTSTADEAGQ